MQDNISKIEQRCKQNSESNSDFYSLYKETERNYLKEHKYLCSSGIALRFGMEVASKNVEYVFSEQNEETRSLLKNQIEQQLASKQIKYQILHHSTQIQAVQRESKEDEYLLALIDPFVLEQAEWESITGGINKVFPNTHKVFLVFTYDKKNTSTDIWTDFKYEGNGPLSILEFPPFHLAVYCSTQSLEFKAQVLKVCEKLYWKCN